LIENHGWKLQIAIDHKHIRTHEGLAVRINDQTEHGRVFHREHLDQVTIGEVLRYIKFNRARLSNRFRDPSELDCNLHLAILPEHNLNYTESAELSVPWISVEPNSRDSKTPSLAATLTVQTVYIRDMFQKIAANESV